MLAEPEYSADEPHRVFATLVARTGKPHDEIAVARSNLMM